MTDLVTEAGGTRVVPQPPRRVWQALAVLRPYCAVCDVSYVVRGTGKGATFSCTPGRPDGGTPLPAGTTGEIVEWSPPRTVTTRLDRADETWTTRVELAGTPDGGTRVTLTVRRAASRAGRLVGAIQRRAAQRLVESTVATELDRLPAHLAETAD